MSHQALAVLPFKQLSGWSHLGSCYLPGLLIYLAMCPLRRLRGASTCRRARARVGPWKLAVPQTC